jgi:hypothetical protein
MMEQTKLVEFRIDDNLIVVELKYKFEEEQLYFFDEKQDSWVPINVSDMIAPDLMTVKDPAVLLK